jgi:RNA polymerase sigma-70 factor (ECF subfamily)
VKSEDNAFGTDHSEGTVQMVPAMYDELRRLARFYLSRERGNHTLQPTALVHEAYLRMAAQRQLTWEDRVQVLALAASMMRRVLLDYAEARNAQKRPNSAVRIPLTDNLAEAPASEVDFLDLHHALEELGNVDARQARIVEMRFFGGMTIEEVAGSEVLSTATVERELRTARLWLTRQLQADKP